MALVALFQPDFGRAATFHDIIDFLVEMLFRVERAGARNFDYVAAPFAFGAVELDEAAAPAQPLPRRHGQVLHLGNAEPTENRDALGFHIGIVRRDRSLEITEARALLAGGFVPV